MCVLTFFAKLFCKAFKHGQLLFSNRRICLSEDPLEIVHRYLWRHDFLCHVVVGEVLQRHGTRARGRWDARHVVWTILCGNLNTQRDQISAIL